MKRQLSAVTPLIGFERHADGCTLNIARVSMGRQIFPPSLPFIIVSQLHEHTACAAPPVDDSFSPASVFCRERPLLGAAVVHTPGRDSS